MLIVFLGADGSGKTTVNSKLTDILENKYKKKVIYKYWRPEILKAPGVAIGLREEIKTGVNPDPYGHKKENPIKSFIRLSYYLVDYFIGGIKISIDKNSIYIFDRYYCDILVDKFRYNFSLPDYIIKLGTIFVKKPDYIFFLDVSVKTLLERKQEIPKEDLIKNVERYRKLVKEKKNAFIINNEEEIDKVIEKIMKIIIKNS